MTARTLTLSLPFPDAAASEAPSRPACEPASARPTGHPATPAGSDRRALLFIQAARWHLDATIVHRHV